MNTETTPVRLASQPVNSLDLLQQLAQSQRNSCLKVTTNSVSYLIYFKRGKLTYATHSVDPFERLERHLRRLSHDNANLSGAVRNQARLNFETESPLQTIETYADYQAICWLLEQKYLNINEAQKLIQLLSEEVIESYLLIDKYQYVCLEYPEQLRQLSSCELNSLLKESQQRVKQWETLAPEILSPYQRLYNYQQGQLQGVEQKLSKFLIGFSFRQLAVLLNIDELKLAKSLQPLIINKKIILRDPQPPFDKLPKISQSNRIPHTVTQNVEEQPKLEKINPTNEATRKLKIACVDDSPTILKEINRFLEGHNLDIFTINDSVKALVEIIRIKPDLILLDVGMPTVDGYKLCSMIRNSSLFKKTPIVMVTGNNTLVDRAKAKIAGATDYMTKPFTQSELLKMVFRYLT